MIQNHSSGTSSKFKVDRFLEHCEKFLHDKFARVPFFANNSQPVIREKIILRFKNIEWVVAS